MHSRLLKIWSEPSDITKDGHNFIPNYGQDEQPGAHLATGHISDMPLPCMPHWRDYKMKEKRGPAL